MEEYPVPNVPLAARVLWHLIRHPETHDQNVWVKSLHGYASSLDQCGTVACAGGWTLLLAGYREIDDMDIQCIVDPDGNRIEDSLASIAQHLLGLSMDEGHFLFFAATNEMAVSFLRVFVQHGLRGPSLFDRVRKLSEVDE